MNGLFLLDTNTISYAASGRSPKALARIVAQPTGSIITSAIVYAEIWYGLKKRQGAPRLENSTRTLFAEIEVLAWSQVTADIYAALRTKIERIGKSLAPLDMLIAAQALEAGAILISSDQAFFNVPDLKVEDWTA